MSVLIGRLLQLVGLIMLPYALMTGLFRDNIALEVRLLFAGGVIFLVGWLLARKDE